MPGSKVTRVAGQIGRRLAHPREHELLRETRFYASKLVSDVVTLQDGELSFVLDNRDHGPAKFAYTHRNPDRQDLREALELLAKEARHGESVRGRTFVEVGANIGTTTLPALVDHGAAKVIAYEPSRRNAGLLLASAAASGLSDRVVMRPVGVSDAAGRAALGLSERNSGDHRIDIVGFDDRSAAESVELVTLDDEVAAGVIDVEQVGMLWMDVQGAEGHALHGASKLLEAGVPVHTEFWPSELGRVGGLDRFIEAVERFYDVVLEVPTHQPTYHQVAQARAVDDLRALAASLPGEEFTNLLLLRD